MRLSFSVVILVLVCLPGAFSLRASEGFEALASVIKSGAADESVLNYIEKVPGQFSFDDDELQYLNDLGVSQKVIAVAQIHGRTKAEETTVATETTADTKQETVQGTPELKALPVAIDDVIAEVPVPAEGEANVSFLYKALAPYGEWMDVDGDSVWQPAEVKVEAGWRPYCNHGHWVKTDRGWAWQSDYAWGWAAFHYGRWSKHPQYGYVWTPGTTWAPAWVAWREAEKHCGWAPLPPTAQYEEGVGLLVEGDSSIEYGLQESDYCFVPYEHMCDCPVAYLLGALELDFIFGHSACIHHNYSEKDKCVMNKGPSDDKVSSATGQPVTNYKVTDAQMNPGDKVQGTKLVDNQYTAYQPTIKNVAPISSTAVVAQQGSSLSTKYSGISTVQRGQSPVLKTSMQTPAKKTSMQSTSASAALQNKIREADAKRAAHKLESITKTAQDSANTNSKSTLSSLTDEARAQKIREADLKREQRRLASNATGSETNGLKQTETKLVQKNIGDDIKQATKVVTQPVKTTQTVPMTSNRSQLPSTQNPFSDSNGKKRK